LGGFDDMGDGFSDGEKGEKEAVSEDGVGMVSNVSECWVIAYQAA
jgi:hypothetical protein